MIYTITRCDICKESMLQVDFENINETLKDILDAVKKQGWTVDIKPGPTYELRCVNCQSGGI